MKFIDLTGQRFGRLTVMERAENKGRKTAWKCVCDCGKGVVAIGCDLVSGHTKSCMCLQRITASIENKTHGLSKDRNYVLYMGIKNRCYNPKHKHYKHYGERGITICDEWLNDYLNFREWCYANGYKEEILPNGKNKWTIDRIDANGNYEPLNCRFVTMSDQNKNRRNTRKR